jgi:hypothetical protein
MSLPLKILITVDEFSYLCWAVDLGLCTTALKHEDKVELMESEYDAMQCDTKVSVFEKNCCFHIQGRIGSSKR